MVNIGLGSDHAGFELKQKISFFLTENGFAIKDYGSFDRFSVDYPDYAQAVALGIFKEEIQFGILLCGTGNGINISANKYPHIRASLCWTPEIAVLARAHNDANILTLPARFVDEKTVFDIVAQFLKTKFEGGRHQRRIDKINLIV